MRALFLKATPFPYGIRGSKTIAALQGKSVSVYKVILIVLICIGAKRREEKLKENRSAGSISPSLPPKAYEVS